MTLSVDQFGKALVSAGLFSADELKALWNAIPIDVRPKDGDGFARWLVSVGKLTEFQARELLAGRGARLVMGDYVVLQEIGAGGMGQVYKARHKRMERVVALKVMSAAAMKDEAAVKRFQREVKAAARLEHPNIVTAYDSGEAGNVKYLVMQFVDGGDLSDLVKKNGPLPIERAVNYVLQAARGLAFAHEAGVVHRDIKPANLLCDKKNVVKILDMGLARIENGDDGLTATEQVMGTVDYMSPEQASNTKAADARSDIYSLGCTLWFLLTGKKAYDGDSMIMRLMAHRDAPLPSLVKARDDVPWALEQAFHKMIAKRAEDRFQSMDEVVAALEPFAGGSGPASGMGSSIGHGGAPNAELSAFLKTVGPGPKTQAKPVASATNLAADATAQFVKEAETDPKSEIHSPPNRGSAAKPQAKGLGPKKPPANKNLILAGAGGAALLVLLGVWFIFRDKDGNEVARVQMPAGGSVTVQQNVPAGTKPAATPSATISFFLPGTTSTGTPTFISPLTSPGVQNLPAGKWGLEFHSESCQVVAKALPERKTRVVTYEIWLSDATVGSVDYHLVGGPNGAINRWKANYNFYTFHGSALSPSKEVIPRRVHLAGVDDGQKRLLFIDGKLVDTRPDGGKIKPELFNAADPRADLILGNSKFRGVIDAVRVSSVVRYDKDFPPPTTFTPDKETVALYLFNEGSGTVLKDSSGNNYHGQITDATWVRGGATSSLPAAAPPPGDYALELRGVDNKPADGGSAWVDVPSLLLSETGPLTLEARVASVGHNEGLVLGTNDLRLRLSAAHWTTDPGRIQPTPIEGKRWYHLAVVRNDAEIRMYVDGKRTGKLLLPARTGPQPPPRTLAMKIGGNNANIRLDEIRISRTARYDQDFTPPLKHLPDADTLALYHCDDGAGDVLKDASGHGHDGKITKPSWVLPDGAPIPVGSIFGAAPAAVRWPLAASKPEDIQWLHDELKVTLTLRSGPGNDLLVKSTTPLPTTPATIVGIDMLREVGPQLTDEAIARLATLTELESLRCDLGIPGAAATKIGMAELAKLTELRSLHLGRMGTADTDYSFLERLPHLEKLGLAIVPLSQWMDHVKRIPRLRDLSLHHMNLSRLSELKECRQLREFNFGGPSLDIRRPLANDLSKEMPWLRIVLPDPSGNVFIEPTAPPPSAAAPFAAPPAAAGVVYLDDLPEVEWKNLAKQPLGKHGKYLYLSETTETTILFHGKPVEHTLWMHPTNPPRANLATDPTAFARYQLDGRYATFAAEAGIHESADKDPASPVTFRVLGDGRELWKSQPMQKRGESAEVAIDIRGVKELRLETASGEKTGGCHATWFMPRLTPAASIPLGGSPGANVSEVVYLDELTEKSYFGLKDSFGKPGRNSSDAASISKNFAGAPLDHALNVHPEDPKFNKQTDVAAALPSHKNMSWLVYDLDGKYALFQSGFRSRTGSSRLQAEVWGDGKKLWESGAPLAQHPADTNAEVDVRGVRELTLFTWCDDGKSHVLLTDPRLTLVATTAPVVAPPAAAGVVYLDDLPELEAVVAGDETFLKHGAAKSHTLSWRGSPVTHSLYMRPEFNKTSFVRYRLDGKYARFEADAGQASGTGAPPKTPMTFRVFGDGRELWKSKPIAAKDDFDTVSVDVRGVQELRLETSCEGKTFQCEATWYYPRLTPVGAVSGTPAPGAKTVGSAPPSAVAPFDATTARKHQEAWAAYFGEPVETTNSVGMKFVVIPPGEFLMGDPAEKHGQVPVTITKPFRFGVHEVTQGQWKAVTGNDDAKSGNKLSQGDNFPASSVSWQAAVDFCQKLTALERADGRISGDQEYRLPTEAEWELACRAGTVTREFWGTGTNTDYAWFGKNSTDDVTKPPYPHEVGLKKPNPWGLYDINGNVSEWCSDWWVEQLTGGTDPQGPSTGTLRVITGASCGSPSGSVNSSEHFGKPPEYKITAGLRVVLSRTASAGLSHVEPPAPAIVAPPSGSAPPPAVFPFDAATARQHQEAWAAYLGVPVEFTNTVGMKFRLIPQGELQMGLGPEFTDPAVEF